MRTTCSQKTLAFNLLLGRGWPPRQQDLDEAEAVCHELGLGGLLERMPAGPMQVVGDSGWHLPHGERSGLYIARALLQGCGIVVLAAVEERGRIVPKRPSEAYSITLIRPFMERLPLRN